MCYDKALRILARMEHPRAAGRDNGTSRCHGKQPTTRLQYEAWVEKLVERKFCHIVSAQVWIDWCE